MSLSPLLTARDATTAIGVASAQVLVRVKGFRSLMPTDLMVRAVSPRKGLWETRLSGKGPSPGWDIIRSPGGIAAFMGHVLKQHVDVLRAPLLGRD